MMKRQQDAAIVKRRWIQRRADKHNKRLLEDSAQSHVVQVQPDGILVCKTELMDKRKWTGQTTHSHGQAHARVARDRSALLVDPIKTNPTAMEASYKTKRNMETKKTERVTEEAERRARVATKVKGVRNSM